MVNARNERGGQGEMERNVLKERNGKTVARNGVFN